MAESLSTRHLSYSARAHFRLSALSLARLYITLALLPTRPLFSPLPCPTALNFPISNRSSVNRRCLGDYFRNKTAIMIMATLLCRRLIIGAIVYSFLGKLMVGLTGFFV